MKLIALLSGGIDSPVAVALALKKGIEVHALHFSPASLSKQGEEKMNKLAEFLKKFGNFHFYYCPFKDIQKSVIIYTPSKFRMLVYRRLMFKIGKKLLDDVSAEGFLTGDSLGQVASQTAENIRTIYSAVDNEIFTPLFGKNKQEIINLAVKFGTFDISILPYEDCCSFMIADHPELRSSQKSLENLETTIPNFEKLIKNSKINKIF